MSWCNNSFIVTSYCLLFRNLCKLYLQIRTRDIASWLNISLQKIYSESTQNFHHLNLSLFQYLCSYSTDNNFFFFFFLINHPWLQLVLKFVWLVAVGIVVADWKGYRSKHLLCWFGFFFCVCSSKEVISAVLLWQLQLFLSQRVTRSPIDQYCSEANVSNCE